MAPIGRAARARAAGRRLLGATAGMLPPSLLERLAAPGLIVTYYHAVGEDGPPHIRHLRGCRDRRRFEADMDLLLSRRAPLDLRELIAACARGEPPPPGRFMVTFDDGLREFAEQAAPILRRKGVPATMFLATDVLDNAGLLFRHKASLLAARLDGMAGTSPWRAARALLAKGGIARDDPGEAVLSVPYRTRALLDEVAALIEVDLHAYLKAQRPYLTRDEVRDLIAAGFTVGGHSRDHPLYRNIPLDQQIEQTLSSMAAVREGFGLDYGAFAFPFNDRGVPAELFDAIFANGVDVAFGTSGFRDEVSPRRLQRIGFEGSLRSAASQIAERCARKLARRAVDKVAGRKLPASPAVVAA